MNRLKSASAGLFLSALTLSGFYNKLKQNILKATEKYMRLLPGTILLLFFSIIYFFSIASADAGYKGITINALLEGHPTDRAVAKLLPEFEKQTGIRVNIEVLPFEKMTKTGEDILNSKSDRYDVIMDAWVNAVNYAEAGHLEPLDSFINNKRLNRFVDISDFVDEYLAESCYKRERFGLPMYGESTFFYYRKDIFDKYRIKVPETMEELKEAAAAVKEKSNGEVYGISLRGREGIHSVYIWSTFLWSFGGRWINEQGRSELDSPEAIKAAEFYSDLLNNYGPPGYSGFGWIENRDIFIRGRAAMSIDATVNGAFNEDTKISVVAGKTGYAGVPAAKGIKLKGGNSALVTHQMYINAYSKKKEAAFLFISWATSKKTQLRGLNHEPNSGVSSKTAINSALYNKKFGSFKKTMLESLKKGNPDYLPRVAQGPVIFQKTGEALSRILSGNEKAEEAMKRVNREINDILSE